jgi:hypothetical protein
LLRRFAVLALAGTAWLFVVPVRAGEQPGTPEQAAAAVPQPGHPSAAPEPVSVQDPLYRLEFKLPAPYWRYYDPKQVASQMPPGCTSPRMSPNLLFVVNHEDAVANVWGERLGRTFLVRSKDELEAYVNAFVASVRAQAGGEVQDFSQSYSDIENPIVHRFEFTAPQRSGAPCGAPPAANAPARMHYLFLHFFVRPKGADAMAFRVFCAAPADVFEALRPEFEYIVGSLRYAGEVDAQFFAPDAPQDKLLTPKDAQQSGGKSALSGFLFPAGLVIIIWMMLRRKKKQPAV